MRFIFILCGALLVLQSCKPADCFYSTGDIQSEERLLETFQTLTINDIFEIKYVPDSVNKIIVEAGENVIPGIETSIEEGVLTLSNENKCNWYRSLKERPKITIHASDVQLIYLNGDSNFEMLDTLIQNKFEFEITAGVTNTNLLLRTNEFKFGFHSGTGDVRIAGSSQTSYLFNAGTGYLWAADFESNVLSTTNNSTGDSYVAVNTKIVARLRSLGNIYYTGYPSEIVVSEELSSGELVEAN